MKLKGPNGTLTPAELVDVRRRNVAEIEQQIAADRDVEERATASAERKRAEAAAAIDPAEMARLEEQARALDQEAAAARNRQTFGTREELEPARAALRDAELAEADEAASVASQRAHDATALFFESPTTARLRKRREAQAARDAELERYRQVEGDPDALPSCWVDEPDPSADAAERVAAMQESDQPAKAALLARKRADDQRRQEQAMELRRLIAMGHLVFSDARTAGADREVLLEARRIVAEQQKRAKAQVSWG